jgi:hypothetical protein
MSDSQPEGRGFESGQRHGVVSVKFGKFSKFFLVRRKLPFFGQSYSLPFSLRSLDIPALLKSWNLEAQITAGVGLPATNLHYNRVMVVVRGHHVTAEQ